MVIHLWMRKTGEVWSYWPGHLNYAIYTLPFRMCKDLSVDNKNCSLDLINMNTVNTIVTPDSPQGDQLSVSIVLVKLFLKLGCIFIYSPEWVTDGNAECHLALAWYQSDLARFNSISLKSLQSYQTSTGMICWLNISTIKTFQYWLSIYYETSVYLFLVSKWKERKKI